MIDHRLKTGLIPSVAVVAFLVCSTQTVSAQSRYPSNKTLWDIVNGLRYVADWPVIRDATRYAEAEALRRYPNDPLGDSGPRNAFKHACWSALLASTLGDAKARNIVYGHENWAGNPYLEKTMDIFNDDVGLSRGILNRNANWFNLANLIQNNVSAGQMTIIRNNRLVRSNR